MNNFSFSRVEEILSKKRGNLLRLDTFDWAILEKWRVKGVPFEAVIEGIETVFRQIAENPRARRDKIKLFHCIDAVEKASLRAFSPPSEENLPENPQTFAEIDAEKRKVINYLEGIAESLKALEYEPFLESSVLRVGLRFGKIKNAFAADEKASIEDLENELNALDGEFSASLLNSFDTEIVETTKNEIETHLKPYKNKMTEDIYQDTLQTLLLKNLRERSNVPRLNLFYLS